MFSRLAESPVPWLSSEGTGTDVIVSSRVRFARNLADFPFPARADSETRREIHREIAGGGGLHPGFAEPVSVEIGDIDEKQFGVLLERRLITREFGEGAPDGRGVMFDEEGATSVLINEEDHVRIQSLFPGLQLNEALERASELDDMLCSVFEPAFSTRLGFLTACPTNVGTGLRASVMLHLPGLVLSQRMHYVMNAAHVLNFAVRGVWGEGSEAIGTFFQFSNQSTLGESEQQIVNRLEGLVREIVRHEEYACLRLIREKRDRVYDHVARSRAILQSAYLLNSEEALNCLSGLRFGVAMGMFNSLTLKVLNELILLVQPGHLQMYFGRDMDTAERDRARPGVIREFLKKGAAAA